MDGVDAATILQEWKQAGRVDSAVKVVLVTGDETVVVKDYNRLLFDHVIVKPVERDVIERIVRDANLYSVVCQ